MGKEFSKEVSENVNIAKKKALNSFEYSEKELERVTKCVVEEYPYLKNVYESMLVTDCRLPDNPIVFANDNFQKVSFFRRGFGDEVPSVSPNEPIPSMAR